MPRKQLQGILFFYGMEQAPRNWYAIKVFFNRVFEMEALLECVPDTETYLPVDRLQLKGQAHSLARKRIAEKKEEARKYVQEGPFIYERVPMITSLIFVHAPAEQLPEIENCMLDRNLIDKRGFIYRSADRQAYAVIPEKQMTSFRLVTSKGSGGLEFFSADDISRFKQGSRVRVKEGPFQGAEGYVRRFRRERRLLVGVEGIVAVATSFIPPELLEIVEE